ncbi:MAG: hypothetical protein K0U98_07750 [Deltaproteobacteria bacterium]|nr:hypothetical protein [Deltaproteobacteria bacterium]
MIAEVEESEYVDLVEPSFLRCVFGPDFFISFYFAEKLLDRMRSVLKSYPPSEYPKLYPQPVEYYKMGHIAFKVINRIIFFLGFVFLAAVILVDQGTFADDGFISEAWPATYGMIQLLPLVLLEVLEFGRFKSMREANSASTRKAQLRPRRLFDFVSPTLLSWAILFYLAAIFLDLYGKQFVLRWSSFDSAAVITGSNLFFIALGARHLYGKKQDPHQAPGDRERQIATNLTSYLYVSLAVSIFFMTVAADNIFQLDFLDATLMSLYFQAIVFFSCGHVLRRLKLGEVNFDVYKEEEAVVS